MKLLTAIALCGELLASLGHKAIEKMHKLEIFAYVEDEPDGEGDYISRPLSADEWKIRKEIEERKRWLRK